MIARIPHVKQSNRMTIPQVAGGRRVAQTVRAEKQPIGGRVGVDDIKVLNTVGLGAEDKWTERTEQAREQAESLQDSAQEGGERAQAAVQTGAEVVQEALRKGAEKVKETVESGADSASQAADEAGNKKSI